MNRVGVLKDADWLIPNSLFSHTDVENTIDYLRVPLKIFVINACMLKLIFSACNSSFGKVMFSRYLSVILFTGGGCLPGP